MAIKATTVREMLAELERLKIVRLGVREHLRAEQLLEEMARLGWGQDRDTLAASLASLLAQNPEQWRQIESLFREGLGAEDGPFTRDHEPRPARVELRDPVDLPKEPPAPPYRDRLRLRVGKLLHRLTEVPTGAWAALVMIVVIMPVVWVLLSGIEPEPWMGRGHKETKVEVVIDIDQQDTPVGPTLEQIEPARSINVAPLPSDGWPGPAWLFWLLIVLSAVQLLFGSSWFWALVAQKDEHRRSLKERGELAEKNVDPQTPYHIERFPPFAEEAMDDSATILSRRARQEQSEELDIGRTVDLAVRSAGRFEPSYLPGGASVPLVVLVDREKGDHPFLDGVEWVLHRWERTGLHFSRYDFRYGPDTVWPRSNATEDETSKRTGHGPSEATLKLEALARRTEGSALLIFSRLAKVEDFKVRTSWLERLAPWPVKALVDVDPRTVEERSDFHDVAAKLVRANLPRFSFTPAGLEAAARTLAGGGEAVVPPPEEPLRPLADIETAIRAWATCAAYVPDPTWPQLEALRRALPEVHQALPDQRHVQRLIEWAWQPLSSEPIGDDGRQLAIPGKIVEELIGQRRKADRDKPDEQRLEQARRLLLAQLQAARAKSEYEERLRQFKIAAHKSVLNGADALELLSPLLGSSVDHEVRAFLGQELRLQDQGCVEGMGWPEATRRLLSKWKARSSRLPLSGLLPLRPLRRRWAVSAVVMALLLVLGSWALWAWRGLPEPTARVAANLPAVWKLNLPDQGSGNLDDPPTGKSLGIVHTALAKVAPMRFVGLSGGEFTMGSPESEEDRIELEGSRHRVRLSGFQIAEHEVTQGQWEAVMGSNPSICDYGCGSDLPVQAVSWLDVVQFLNRLTKLELEDVDPCYEIEGETVRWSDQSCQGYRLPTEAEWEYAARAGTKTRFSFGDDESGLDAHAWYSANSEVRVHPVGTKEPNRWRLRDVHGNVWEWVWDWYGPYSSRSGSNPTGPQEGQSRVLRGGSFGDGPGGLRSADRLGSGPTIRYWDNGFRCARSSLPQP